MLYTFIREGPSLGGGWRREGKKVIFVYRAARYFVLDKEERPHERERRRVGSAAKRCVLPIRTCLLFGQSAI